MEPSSGCRRCYTRDISSKGRPTSDEWLAILDEHLATESVLPLFDSPDFAEAIISDSPYRILEANAKFLMILGFKPVEAIQSLRIIKGPETDDGRLCRLIRKAFDNCSCDESIVLYRKDGEEVTCVVRGIPAEYDSLPACKLRILPYSFESADAHFSVRQRRNTRTCMVQCRTAEAEGYHSEAARRNAPRLEQFRICGDSAPFRELLGFRPGDAVQVPARKVFGKRALLHTPSVSLI